MVEYISFILFESILDQPEYFPSLKIICTDGNPLIRECSSGGSAAATVGRDVNRETNIKPSRGGGDSTKKCESEQDSGVASQTEEDSTTTTG